MQDKRFYPYLFLHAGIVTLWVILDRVHKGITNDGTINLLSIAILLCYFNLFYLHVMASRRAATVSECSWNVLSVSFIAALMYDGFSILYTGIFLAFALIIGIILVRTDASPGKIVRLLFGIVAIILSFFHFQIFPAVTILVGMFLGIFLDYRYRNLKQINILPIAQRKARYVLVFMIPLFTVVLYCFDLSTLQVNVFFQLIMLLFESFAVIHLGDMEARYKELTKYYGLTNYIANEREDFSRVLHNDVLQDIGGAKNLLSLRSPDIDETKRILSDLELRVRNIMNFYSSNIFSGYSSWEHIEYMLAAIKKLYPKKNIFVDFTIDSEARIALKKDNNLEQAMQIIKELVNNVYKHAAATFIHLEIVLNEESKLVIICQSDGAKPSDIENILSSKGGMLFLTVLINGNGGNIQYLEKDGILTATAVLGRKNEDIII
jgi:two-component system secretion system sensor histidine kinase SalK